jgi:hypothetical protein
MPRIKNKLFQPVMVMMGGGKTVYLQSREEVEVTEKDLDSPHLKGMIVGNDIALVEEEKKSISSSAEEQQKLLPSPKGKGK